CSTDVGWSRRHPGNVHMGGRELHAGGRFPEALTCSCSRSLSSSCSSTQLVSAVGTGNAGRVDALTGAVRAKARPFPGVVGHFVVAVGLGGWLWHLDLP